MNKKKYMDGASYKGSISTRIFSLKYKYLVQEEKIDFRLTLNADGLRKALWRSNEANWNLFFFFPRSSLYVVMKKHDEQWFSDMSLWEVSHDEWQIRKLKGRNQYLLLLCSKLWEGLDQTDRCYFSNHTVGTFIFYKLSLSLWI